METLSRQIFKKILKISNFIKKKSVHWQQSCSVRMDRHDEDFRSFVDPLSKDSINPYPANVDNMASSYQC